MSIVERALEKAQQRQAEDAAKPALLRAGVRPGVAPIAAPQLANAEASSTTGEYRVFRTIDRKIVHFDVIALRAAGVLPPVESERRLAEEHRRIKRPLAARAIASAASGDLRGRLIMVGSALPGEGKTFTSVNLALSLAREKDLHVLLIDADVAKPQISGLLGINQDPGLLDLLRDDNLDVESAIQDTDYPGLSILPAGARSDTDTELLASQRMKSVMAELARNDVRRLIVLDSPPLLLTNESRELASCVGQVVLVVRADVTPRAAVFDAIDALGEGCPIGLVLNQATVSTGQSRYYGYGYGYGYGDAAAADLRGKGAGPHVKSGQ